MPTPVSTGIQRLAYTHRKVINRANDAGHFPKFKENATQRDKFMNQKKTHTKHDKA